MALNAGEVPRDGRDVGFFVVAPDPQGHVDHFGAGDATLWVAWCAEDGSARGAKVAYDGKVDLDAQVRAAMAAADPAQASTAFALTVAKAVRFAASGAGARGRDQAARRVADVVAQVTGDFLGRGGHGDVDERVNHSALKDRASRPGGTRLPGRKAFVTMPAPSVVGPLRLRRPAPPVPAWAP